MTEVCCVWQDIAGVDSKEWCKVHMHVRDKLDCFHVLVIDKTHRDIVDVISKFIRLRPYKRFFVGRCPFHNDSGMSLEVIRGQQRYRCLFCENSGTALDFILNYLNLPIDRALEYIQE